MILPDGHAIHKDGDISQCPFFSINEKAKKRRQAEEQKEDNKPKREEEYYGGGGGCPFMMSGNWFLNIRMIFVSKEEESKDGAC